MSIENYNVNNEGRCAEKLDLLKGEIFKTAIELLKNNGTEEKGFMWLRYQVFRFSDESEKPIVTMEMKAGNNLERAGRVKFTIKGMDPFFVSKSGPEGQESYYAKRLNREGFFHDAYPDEIIGYRNTLRKIKTQVNFNKIKDMLSE
ncbi:MAG: hypothetical protein A2687_02405 [Candidatus Levybacteria bacterium RIFCSPHIGHO2_01_FULL_38_26]|nr:MAG: hypothetical protein A2687_02405 [Candidatus Levybacteria bacterium RIFCSPHIGHO2_01_FULL_38_26]